MGTIHRAPARDIPCEVVVSEIERLRRELAPHAMSGAVELMQGCAAGRGCEAHRRCAVRLQRLEQPGQGPVVLPWIA